jgi:methylmalonyl-CoA/ethylmalonyl-CoA epimerase
VADIGAAYADLKSKGVVFRDKPHLVAKLPDREIWMSFFDDTEGNVLAITSEVSAK